MNKFFRLSFLAFTLCSTAMLISCDEDPPLPDNITEFQSDAQGMGAADAELTVNLKLAREADADGNITIGLTTTGVTYGTDFTTTPAADANNKITIPVAAGATEASFKITKTNTTGLKGDEKAVFTIESVGEELVLGAKNAFTLSFSEIIATSATMEVNGGGTNGNNRVFIDLSGNRQTAVSRNNWDLAFSSKADEFRVVLNSSNKMLAYKLDKSNLGDVTASDTVGLGAHLSTDAIFGTIAALGETDPVPDWVKGSLAWMDDRNGDLTKTAIAQVSATDAENKVYIINRGTNTSNGAIGWKKIRVIRSGSNYTLQYADIASPNFSTVTVTKNTATSFNYVSLTSGAVVGIEPDTKKWDIAWTGFTNITTFDGVVFFPYYNQDIILTNIYGGTKAFAYSTGTTGTKTYDTFTEADLSGITYSTSQLGIGSTWRALNPPPAVAALNESRFYIIQDADGNIYKLKFTALIVNGERGKPQFKFALLKKAA